MGLFDFLGNALGSQNKYHVDPMNLDKTDYANAIQQSQAAALGSLNQGNAAGAQQAALAQALAAQANGQGQSLAQLQLQQAADQNLKNNVAMIAGVKGLNPAQAARQVAMSNVSQGQNLANQSAQLALNEQINKQQMLANLLNQQRGQDIGQQSANTQMFGLTGNLQNQQNQTALDNYYRAHAINAGVAAQNTQTNNAIGGGLFSALGSVGASMLPGGGAKAAAYDGGKFDGGETVAVSPGEKIIGASGSIKTVPGQAKHKGDDPRNDTVIADLREPSIVVPRTKSESKAKTIEFLKHMKESNNKRADLSEILSSHQELKKQLADINEKLGKWMPKK